MPSTSRTASAAKPKRKAAKTVAKRAAKVTSASAELSGSVTPEPRWRSRASDRATRALHARADERNERFLAAALELLSKGESDLSVRDVVELSQMSLRSFYESFDGKDDLLLAIYEEATFTGLTRQLRAVEAASDDPLARLRAFMSAEWIVVEKASQQLQRALAIYHQRLAETRPAELAAVLEPQHQALTQLLAACRAVGMAGPHLDDSTNASILMHLMMTTLQARVLDFRVGGEAIDGDQVWAFLESTFTVHES